MKKIAKIILIIISIYFILFLISWLRTFWWNRFPSVETREIANREEKEPLTPIEVVIEIGNGKIEPKTFKVRSGQKVNLTIISMEGTHSIRFEDENFFWVEPKLNEAGETLKVPFTAPKEKGEYKFFCGEPGHREAGEEGVMIVE